MVDVSAGGIFMLLVIVMCLSMLNGGAFCIKILENKLRAGY